MSEIGARRRELRAVASAARAHAHVPYSGFAVGAAVEMEDGRVFGGGNVETAALPQSICAERNAISTAVSAGCRQLRRVYVIAEIAAPPCGGCRSVMAEFGTAETEVIVAALAGDETAYSLGELLPHAFETSAAVSERLKS